MRLLLLLSLPAHVRGNCYVKGYRLDTAPAAEKTQSTTAMECKNECASNGNCTAWTWQDGCWSTAHLDEQPPLKLTYDANAISYIGDCVCPTDSVVSFPGATPSDTHALFGDKMQPVGLQCWPDNLDDGGDGTKSTSCDVKVLQQTSDTAGAESNWKGNCLGLSLKEGVADCEENCKANPFCSTWQNVVNETAFQSGCWQGVGYDCEKGRKTTMPSPAGRFQHGQVRVIAQMTTHQLKGLMKVFGEDAYGSRESAQENCKEVCYSDLNCQYWQYFNGTGCFVENAPGNMMPYPLSLSDTSHIVKYDTNGGAGALLGGEYIQHYCTLTTTTTTEDTYFYDWNEAENQFTVGQKIWVPKDTGVCVVKEPAVETDASNEATINDSVEYSVTRGYTDRQLICKMARRLSLGNATTEQGQYGNVTQKLDDGLYRVQLDDGRTVVTKQEDLLPDKPPPPTVAPATTPAPAAHGWGASILTAALGVLCVLGLVLAWLFSGSKEEKKKKKKEKTRAVAVEPEAPVVQSAPPPASTTSVVLASATPTYTAAPVTIAAPSPVATYQAPVTYASAPVTGSYVVAAPAAHSYATSQVVHTMPSQVVQAAPTSYVQSAVHSAYVAPTGPAGSAVRAAVPMEPVSGH